MMPHNIKITLPTIRRYVPIIALISCLFIFVVNLYAEVDRVIPGQADKIFDKSFLQSISNVLLYEQIVKIVGVKGVKVGISSIKIPGEKYHWNGLGNSSFNIRVSSGKVIDANVITPEGRIVSLEGNGEVIDLGK
ncbi:MAG: hypothetical protein ACYDG4_15305 [Desulfuromonadaceae bacterium]